jgi:hypothetical protein
VLQALDSRDLARAVPPLPHRLDLYGRPVAAHKSKSQAASHASRSYVWPACSLRLASIEDWIAVLRV